MKIVQLSDIHLRMPESSKVPHSPAARLSASVRFINECHPDADLCVVTGDLVDDGGEESYAALRAILDDLKMERRLLLGNHDRRAAFRTIFPEEPADPCGYIQSSRDVGAIRLVFLDTLSEGQAGGLLCDVRLQFLRDQLATSLRQPGAQPPVLVFMHHPPADIGLASLDAIGLANRDAFWQALRASGRECHVFCGHVHRHACIRMRGTSVHTSRGLHSRIVLAAGQRDVALEQAPPGLSVIEIGADGAIRVIAHELQE